MTEMVAAWKPTSPPAVWSLRTGARVGLLLDDPGFLNPASVSFSPNQKIVAVGGARDGSAFVFDLSTGRPLLRLNTRPQVHTKAVQFSPDGQRILTTNSDGEARLWNATTGKPIGPVVRMPGSLRSPVFSRDGRWAAIDNAATAAILDGLTGNDTGHRMPAGGKVGFSADGQRLGTAWGEGNAQVWDVAGGDPVTEPMRHASKTTLPELSPDGRFLKVEDRCLNIWAVPPALPKGMTPPDWLLDLATLCASQIVNDAGQLVDASEAVLKLDEVRRQLTALPAGAPLADWGRWLLDERPNRPIAPGFTITPAEADQLPAKIRAAVAAP